MTGVELNATFATGFVHMFAVEFSHLFAVEFSHLLARVMYLQWLLGLQLVVCLTIGFLVSRKTGRALFECLAAAFLAAVVPVAGYAVMLAAYFWLPRLPAANVHRPSRNQSPEDQPPEVTK